MLERFKEFPWEAVAPYTYLNARAVDEVDRWGKKRETGSIDISYLVVKRKEHRRLLKFH